jgi:hypothetical protein
VDALRPLLVPSPLGPNTEPYGSYFVSDARGWTASGTAASNKAICKLYTPLGAQDPTWTACLSFCADSSYTNSTDTVIAGYDPIDTPDVLMGQAVSITAVQNSNQFKLMLTVENPVSGWEGGVMYTGWNGGTWITGILSGITAVAEPTPVGPPLYESQSGWVGGMGLIDLVNWAWQNWS